MIYTVTFNPSLDYIVTVENFAPGKTNRTDSELMLPGGKGINVSIVLSNLGVQNTAIYFAAGFVGEEITRRVEESGIRAERIPVEEGCSRINLKMRSYDTKERCVGGSAAKQAAGQSGDDGGNNAGSQNKRQLCETEINGRGPVITSANVEELYRKLDQLQAGDTLVLAGSIPGSMPQTIYSDILERLSGRGIRFVVDATGELLLRVLQYRPFLVKPNHHELGELFNVTITTRDEAIPYAKKLQEMGAQNVIVSMAGEGAVLVTEDQTALQSAAPQGTLVNAVGAGDSMVAGFLAGWEEATDATCVHAFRMGLAAGSASAFSEHLATREEVLHVYKTMLS